LSSLQGLQGSCYTPRALERLGNSPVFGKFGFVLRGTDGGVCNAVNTTVL
jgi:hypothetical protein